MEHGVFSKDRRVEAASQAGSPGLTPGEALAEATATHGDIAGDASAREPTYSSPGTAVSFSPTSEGQEE